MNKNKGLVQGNVSKSGLVISPDGAGYMVDWTELPASDHFFFATDCHVKKDATGLVILFGQSHAFDEDVERYDLTVEIRFPMYEATQSLYRSVFVEMSGNGKNTFFNSVKEGLGKLKIDLAGLAQKKIKKLPLDRKSASRMFPANFAAMSFASTQALIEFYEVTPDLVHLAVNRNKMRPQAGVKPIISVILDSVTLCSFMEQCSDLITPTIKTNEEVRS